MNPPRAIERLKAIPRPRSATEAPAAVSLLKANFRKSSSPFSLEVDFQAAPGFTILFGPSGAGKTTLPTA